MKHFFYLVALSATLFAAPISVSAREPLEGTWIDGSMTIRIAPCGAALCGTITRASAKQQAKAQRGSGTELVGATLIRDIKPTGPSSYRARVFLADRNMYANGNIELAGRNQIKVRGCLFGVLCKARTWDRVR